MNSARGSSHTRSAAPSGRYVADFSVPRISSCTGKSREAARSAPRNIAEGFGRYTHRDFARFVRIAKSSEVELLNHFGEAFDSGHVTDAERRALEHAAKKAIKAANGLIRYLESTPDP